MMMIPQEVKDHFQKIVTHEMPEMDQTLAEVLGATHANMALQGVGRSGTAMRLLRDATNSLKARAQLILGQLLRCLTAHHVELSAETITEASTLLREAILMVREQLFKNPIFAMPGFGQSTQQLQTEYDQEGPRLITRLITELELAAAASRDSPSRSAATFNFHGPVGLVQTGDGSQATVHQHIDAGVKSEIAAALQLLLEELDKPENTSIGNRRELRELIVEAKAEVEKPESNALKLGSSLRVIAEPRSSLGRWGRPIRS